GMSRARPRPRSGEFSKTVMVTGIGSLPPVAKYGAGRMRRVKPPPAGRQGPAVSPAATPPPPDEAWVQEASAASPRPDHNGGAGRPIVSAPVETCRKRQLAGRRGRA